MEAAPLSQFVILAQTAQGRACEALVKDALDHSGVFLFGELLDCPNVRALANSDESRKLLDLLRIFAYGTYPDYMARKAELPELNTAQCRKLQLLTIVSLATKEKLIKFSDLEVALDVTNARKLEDIIIEAMYQNLIVGKMDQEKRCLQIESCACRDCREEDVDYIIETLTDWQGELWYATPGKTGASLRTVAGILALVLLAVVILLLSNPTITTAPKPSESRIGQRVAVTDLISNVLVQFGPGGRHATISDCEQQKRDRAMKACKAKQPQAEGKLLESCISDVCSAVEQYTGGDRPVASHRQLDDEADTLARCVRFVVLTMQRSGSTSLLSYLQSHPRIDVTWEAFNMGSEQSGWYLLKFFRLTLPEVQKFGARSWANRIFDQLERSAKIGNLTPGSACAVGFKLMNTVDLFPESSYRDFFGSPGLRFVILERRDTHAQWVSMQRACWTGSWDGKENSDYKRGKKITLAHIAKREFCGDGPTKLWSSYRALARRQFQIYHNLTNGLKVLHVATETVGRAQSRIADFLFEGARVRRLRARGRTRNRQKIVVREFQQELFARFGDLPAAWRKGFDGERSGLINFTRFSDGCKAAGYNGNVSRLWDMLDVDRSGEISLNELSVDLGEPDVDSLQQVDSRTSE